MKAKYAILCSSRSGSTHLCDLLKSTNRAGNPEEFFNKSLDFNHLRKGKGFVDGIVNGTKTFISNGINCDLVVIAARNPEVDSKHNALSLYIVEDGTPGFTRGRHLEKMGMHSLRIYS